VINKYADEFGDGVVGGQSLETFDALLHDLKRVMWTKKKRSEL
jgi:hypothetical protein